MVILLAPCADWDAGTGVGAASAAAVEPITTKSDVVRSENLVVFMTQSNGKKTQVFGGDAAEKSGAFYHRHILTIITQPPRLRGRRAGAGRRAISARQHRWGQEAGAMFAG